VHYQARGIKVGKIIRPEVILQRLVPELPMLQNRTLPRHAVEAARRMLPHLMVVERLMVVAVGMKNTSRNC
jgi:hypothetical protein